MYDLFMIQVEYTKNYGKQNLTSVEKQSKLLSISQE